MFPNTDTTLAAFHHAAEQGFKLDLFPSQRQRGEIIPGSQNVT